MNAPSLPSATSGMTGNAQDQTARRVIAELGELQASRSTWDYEWQDIVDLVRPQSTDFTVVGTPGRAKSRLIYDGTAPLALERLAAGLHSHLTNPTDRWFGLKVDPAEVPDEGMLDYETRLWLDSVSDILYREYAREEVGLNMILHEAYLDIGAFGTCIVGQEYDYANDHLIFQAFPLAKCYIAEDGRGRVNKIYILRSYTKRQLPLVYTEDELSDHRIQRHLEAGSSEDYVTVINCIAPRKDRVAGRYDKRGKAYASLHVLQDVGLTLRESGYDRFPFHVARWSRLSGEVYGRSPAKTCLPDIRMLNRMELDILKATEKAIDPPLILPHKAFLRPLRTNPGALNYTENFGFDQGNIVQTLEHRGNIPIGLEMAEQKREQIKRAFHTDWLELEFKKERQTAFEIQERREENLRFLSPAIARLESELLSGMIKLSFHYLDRVGRIPPVPEGLRGRSLVIAYSSPAAKAQEAIKAVDMARFLQDLTPLAQVDPTVFDAVNVDEYAAQMAKLRGVPAKIIKPLQQIKAEREQAKQEQAMQNMMAAAEPVSKAVKNIADANAAGGMF